jgi:hypothetical protein
MFTPDSRNYIAKRDGHPAEILGYERLLAEGLRPFLHELVMVEGGVMVSYVCGGQHANLGDIIVSSSECAVKPGRLHYGNHAQLDFDWGEEPAVTLAMELRDERLTAFFHIIFGQDHVGVDILGIQFAETLADPEQRLRLFAAALADARLPAAGTADR